MDLEVLAGHPPQYSCLENSMDRGAWQATVHGVSRVPHDLATKSNHRYKVQQGWVKPGQRGACLRGTSATTYFSSCLQGWLPAAGAPELCPVLGLRLVWACLNRDQHEAATAAVANICSPQDTDTSLWGWAEKRAHRVSITPFFFSFTLRTGPQFLLWKPLGFKLRIWGRGCNFRKVGRCILHMCSASYSNTLIFLAVKQMSGKSVQVRFLPLNEFRSGQGLHQINLGGGVFSEFFVF